MSYQYQEVSTNKEFTDLNDIQFKIKNIPGQEIIAGSLELDGQLTILINKVAMATANNVQWDHMLGAHNLIAQTSEKINGRLISDNLNYPRYVKMIRNARMQEINVGAQSNTVRELCAPNDAMTQPLLVTTNPPTPFSFTPYLSVNQSSRNITYQDAQTIEIDLRLTNKDGFFGAIANVSQLTFTISNLKLRYRIQPAGKYSNPVVYPIVGYKVFDISSNKSTNDILTPIPTKWVMSSFNVKQDLTGATIYDNPQRFVNPNASKIKYLYNDQNNVGVSFQLESQEEMAMQYLLAVGDREDNNINPKNINGNNSSFCVASSVGMLPPKTKITYQYDTLAGQNGIVYNVYTFFLGEIAI